MKTVLLYFTLFLSFSGSAEELWILVDSNKKKVAVRVITPQNKSVAKYQVLGNGDIYSQPIIAFENFEQVILSIYCEYIKNNEITVIAISTTGEPHEYELTKYKEKLHRMLKNLKIRPRLIINRSFATCSFGAHVGKEGVSVLSSRGSLLGFVNSNGEVSVSYSPLDYGFDGFGLIAFGKILTKQFNLNCEFHGEKTKVIDCQSCRMQSSILSQIPRGEFDSETYADRGCLIKRGYQASLEDFIIMRVIRESVRQLIEMLKLLKPCLPNEVNNLCIIGCACEPIIDNLPSDTLEALNFNLIPIQHSDIVFEGLYFLIKEQQNESDSHCS